MPPNSQIEAAIKIARTDLRWCYRDKGIFSGTRLVYWSWDSFFASLGALPLGDFAIVKRNLELYLSFQRADGSVPKRISNPFYYWRFLGIPVSEAPEKQKPIYWNTYYTAPSLTQNPTLLIAFLAYIEYTHDNQFARLYFGQLEKIMQYLETKEEARGFLKEGIGGGWAESVLKRGVISFTNMCYARSLYCMAELCTRLGEQDKELYYRGRYNTLREAINRWLWSDDEGGFYSDWISNKRHHHFATDGNLLAIWWGIADRAKAVRIQRKISALALEDDIPIKLAYDPYDFWRIFIFNRLGGMKDYHVGFSWTWLGCVDVLAKLRLDQREAAEKILERIATVIVRDGTVHETYNKNQAVHTPFYKSEHPWAWGAGLFICACQEAGFTVKD